ncbi:insulin-induced protein (INSIG) domain-containing protein [Trichoderma breve]|uniref:Insulin-induced protein (INSIG) domain-containing protein n=1 Tax=Trichoderma breve TaxID=2034170 RepID=A0A9W9B9G9_9HYPO|nr:insulin-induced protein (INSIG) domain-containing protein [Trichoderma breve]KAJ4858422.1 insulin-induced protein (INSIG) domain-containing protein [Trichoderma breve]
MNDNTAADGPPLFRPIPRRPFVFDLKCSTPQPQSLTPPKDDESDSEEQRLEDEILLARFRRDLLKSGFLDLNTSTLAGDDDEEELHNPWGTGAGSPVKRRDSLSRATYELMRDRSRRQSHASTETNRPKQPTTPGSRALWLASRALVLFVLGAGYGVLVTHLHQEQGLLQLSDAGSGIPRYNGSYTAMWGFALAGVGMGALQPWVDGEWDGMFGCDSGDTEVDSVESTYDDDERQPLPETDWALVMRAIGVFVGVAFAVRRLSWTSSSQVSLAVALANLFLWWLIDRTMPALVVSTVVGLAGTVFLLSANSSFYAEPQAEPAMMLGGIASQETIEAGIWILSVLFCTCLCFGNIGRRLARGRSKGRWAGQHLYGR